ncbi:GGDEF domain-containing protein [Halomicronema hongdechloris C2206]|uniref:GGDEF domain-containing protein n=1 Tax=Halomicronema hongdechloris C2206 TaxID=1641165 RepID=A0A1Z3HPC1_9CYAN|nr:EAL domain-containing protein [Halomicronema hongdechloris]ASC72164.1 GGDEF domain-containing protein [Halomicronema hongdechloris C2206]
MDMLQIEILLIEDDEADVDLIHEYLSEATNWQVTIHQVNRLAAGIDCLQHRPYDLVLLDLSLPDSSGLDTFLRLRHHSPQVPIVILSGNTDQTLAFKAVQAGAQDYLLKGDVDTQNLTRAIRYAIERHRLWTELTLQKQALEASQHRWHILVNQHSDGLVVTNTQDVIQFANPAAERLFGRSAAELVGTTLPIAGIDNTAELLLNTSDNHPLTAEIRLAGVQWEGTPASLISLRDITDRKQAEQTLRKQQALLRTIISSAPIVLFAVNTQGQFTLAEGQGLSCFPLTPEQWVGKSLDTLAPDLAPLPQDMRRALQGETFMATRKLLGHTLECWYTPLWDGQSGNRVEAIVGVITDSTTISKLREERDRFFELSLDLLFIADQDLQFQRLNPAFLWKLGYETDALIGCNFYDLIHPDDVASAQHHIEQLRQGEGPGVLFQTRCQTQTDTHVWIAWSLAYSAEQTTFYAVGRDITEQKQFEQRLHYQANHDALTGLPNRAYFTEILNELLQPSRRRKSDLFAVLFIDLDRFKIINDSLGHLAGDHLLITIAQRLQGCLRDGDLVARLGGDEFAILLNQVSGLDDVITASERMLQSVAQPMVVQGQDVHTSASIGIALGNDAYTRAEDLLRDADTAMYQAKSSGKAQYAIFQPGMHDYVLGQLQLANDLVGALDRDEFYLEYQPIIALNTSHILGIEALIRWQHPQRGQVSPIQFIAIAEETGLIIAIGNWVLQQACHHLRQILLAYPSLDRLFISVNLSAKQLAQLNFVSWVTEVLRANHLSPSQLQFEITENLFIHDASRAAQTLEQLRQLGVGISLDDFGTGYSSLNHLYQMSIQTLKIDRSFIGDIESLGEKWDVVQAIVALARIFQLQVIAEGVETPGQRQQLCGLSCVAAQGYLLSRPLPFQTLLPWLDNYGNP